MKTSRFYCSAFLSVAAAGKYIPATAEITYNIIMLVHFNLFCITGLIQGSVIIHLLVLQNDLNKLQCTGLVKTEKKPMHYIYMHFYINK